MTKMDAVRACLKNRPDASTGDVVKHLEELGMTTTRTSATVMRSAVRKEMGMPALRVRRATKAASARKRVVRSAKAQAKPPVETSSRASSLTLQKSGTIDIDVLVQAKRLVERAGGVDKALAAIDAFGTLVG